MHRSTVEQYVLEVVARAGVARDRCSSLLTLDYPSSAPQNLARTLAASFGFLAKAVEALLVKAAWDEGDEISTEDLSLIRYTDRAICQLAETLRSVEAASTDRLPREVVPAFERLARELVPHVTVMLRPQWTYNYTFTLSDMRAILAEYLGELIDLMPEIELESDVLSSMRDPFHIVAFPQLEQDNILLHCLLGHELGHLLVDKFLTEERTRRFSESVLKEVHALAEERMKPWGDGVPLLAAQMRVDLINNILQEVLRYWRRALEELLSDLVGAIMFGPAALFSTFEMAWQSGYDVCPSQHNNYYPPWRLRLRTVLGAVTSLGAFFPVSHSNFGKHSALERAAKLNGHWEAIVGVAECADDVYALGKNPFAALAYRDLPAWLEEGKKYLLLECGMAKRHRQLKPSNLLSVLSVLIERLDSGIPPNAIEKTLDDRTRVRLVHIINAAWYAKLSRLEVAVVDGRLDADALKARSRRNRLTIKAIQFADLADEYWRQVKPRRFRDDSKKE